MSGQAATGLCCVVGIEARFFEQALTYTNQLHPRAILTDLAPEGSEVRWYSKRARVKTRSKDIKHGLGSWPHNTMLAAGCLARLWLAIAVAQVWSVSAGCQTEAEQPQEPCGLQLSAKANRPSSAQEASRSAYTTAITLRRAWTPGLGGSAFHRPIV